MLDQIELAKQLMLHGASEEATATEIGIPLSRLKAILAFEDHASPTVKEAARQGRLSASACFVLAEVDDHAEQDKKLGELLIAPKPTVRAARVLTKPDESAPPPGAPCRGASSRASMSTRRETTGCREPGRS